MNTKLFFLGILLLVGLVLTSCVTSGGYGYGYYGYDSGFYAPSPYRGDHHSGYGYFHRDWDHRRHRW